LFLQSFTLTPRLSKSYSTFGRLQLPNFRRVYFCITIVNGVNSGRYEFPIKIVFDSCFTHKHGTAFIYIEYCNSPSIRTLLNTKIAIPADFGIRRKNVLFKRVLAAWGISRVGTRLSTHFNILLRTLNFHTTDDRSNLFFWRPRQVPGDIRTTEFQKQMLKKETQDICAEEVANAVKQVAKEQISMSKDELIRETAKIFGFARIGSNVEQAMVRGLGCAISARCVSEENGRIVFND
jgi:hypothetical protein